MNNGDDPAHHKAASDAGRLAGMGRIDGAAVLPVLIAAAQAASPGRDAMGLFTRLTHSFDDAARDAAAAIAREARMARPAITELAPLRAVAASLRAPGEIPPRAWLYGRRLIRGFVSVMVAPGGVGKSALALGQAVCLATGRAFLGEAVHQSCPAWVFNLEDPADETDRRLAALMLRHDIPAHAIAGRLFLHSGRTRGLVMAELDEAGFGRVAHPDRAAVTAEAQARGIGLIVVDPFVKCHRLDENSNAQIDAAIIAWAEIAEAARCAVLLVHHVRKGAGANGMADVEAARGARALTDAARNVAVLSPMGEAEAERLSVDPAQRWRHVRLDDAKANLAAHASGAAWFRLDGVRLGNGTPDYPHGDDVAVMVPWKPPALAASLSPAALNQALDAIAAGPGDGMAYAAKRGRAAGRWVGFVLVDQLAIGEPEAARLIAAWLRAGLLREETYHDTRQRKDRVGIRVIDAKRPSMTHTGEQQ